ncbi:MAG: leucine-rich repeat domain-containing protein [Aureispira sp.]|nr:leucine-rich repeat domain-containing protein [Aureispira sp.]
MNNFIKNLEREFDIHIVLSARIKAYKNTYTKDEYGNITGLSLYNLYKVKLENLNQLIPLAEHLTELILISCHTIEISAITHFKQLVSLKLVENQISHSDIEHILGLKKLTCLELAGTELNDTSIFAELTCLESLNIDSSYHLKEVKGLKKLSQLRYLSCGGIDFPSIEAIEGHEGITHFSISCSAIESMVGIERFPNLTHLDFSSTSLKQIEGLEGLKQLKTLDLSASLVSKISGLDTLENLEKLNISWAELSKIEGLAALFNLIELDLGRNKITKIEGLDTLVNLKKLVLRENEIKKVDNLETLVNLEYLNIEMNKIKEIDTRFLFNIRKPCQVYLGGTSMKSKELGINVPEHIDLYL